jgi:hypothetical protein
MANSDRIKVHNAEWFIDTMQAADWSNPGEGVDRAPKLVAKGKSSSRNDLVAKQREAFAEKQSVREKEFQMKFDVAKKEAERRLQERQLVKELQFEDRFRQFLERNKTLVTEVDGAIQADVAWRQRKKERLFNEWTTKVFQPMQDQLNEQLASLSDKEISERRRDMFEKFLLESNRKANGLFRDIIIESDYDPLQQAAHATLKYVPVSMADDPTKNRATRELGDRMASGLLKLAPEDERQKVQRGTVPVEMWERMEATPHGRYNEISSEPKKPNFNASKVVLNHFDIPRGAAGVSLLRLENNARGKQMVSPPRDSECGTVKDCLTMLPPIGR